MKRISHLYAKIYDLENIKLADKKARKGKLKSYGVKKHDRDKATNLQKLRTLLKNKTYQTSNYTVFTIQDPKERVVYRLPYFPDRICHHAIMNILEPIWVKIFTADTYSCIKGRGLHAIIPKLNKALKDRSGTKYCLKMDIKKFYPSVNHGILKQIIRKKIKDPDVLALLDEIIDSAPGLPIGNYTSQYLANLYLAYFDHWVKESLGVKYYWRYADDIVILSGDKAHLHNLRREITQHMDKKLKLQIKSNWQVFPVDARGIDFIGYKFYHTHTLMRKSIKKKMFQTIIRHRNNCGALGRSMAAYNGWLKHADTKHLIAKVEKVL